MNQLKTFNHSIFGNVRVLAINDNPLFNLNDIGFSLGYTRPNANGTIYLRKDKLANICESLEIAGVTPGVTSFPISKDTVFENTYIKENDLYDLSLESRAKHARQFRKWITSDVIPSIRKHGAYMTPEKIEEALLNPDTIIQLATTLKEERSKREQAEKTIQKQQPLVTFAETCMTSEKSLLVRELAKLCTKQGIVTGEKRLWQKLRDWGLVFKNKTEPYQEYVERGYFEVSQGVKQTQKGSFTWLTMRVKPKGQVYIINRLKQENEQLKAVK